jgi:putative membrane protein
MMSMMGGWGILSTIFWIAILGFVIYGIMLLIMKPFEKKEANDNSLQILRERYARGEIDQEEFDKMKSILKNN